MVARQCQYFSCAWQFDVQLKAMRLSFEGPTRIVLYSYSLIIPDETLKPTWFSLGTGIICKLLIRYTHINIIPFKVLYGNNRLLRK